MKDRESNSSIPPEEAALEHWLRDTLAREAARNTLSPDGSPDCLDVDTLAAWADGGLAAPLRARAESHAATCTRCQAMLAAMVRTADVPQSASGAAVAGSSLKKWLMMLGAPLAAAAALTLWFAVEPSREDASGGPAASSEAKAQAAYPADALAKQDNEARSGARVATQPPVLADRRDSTPLREEERKLSRQVAANDASKDKKREADIRIAEKPTNAGAVAGSLAAAAPPPPPVAEPVAAPTPIPGVAQPPVVAGRDRAQQGQVITSPQTPQTQQQQAADLSQFRGDAQASSRATVEERVLSPLKETNLDAAARMTEVQSTRGAVRWRVGPGRPIEHSNDGGASWATQYTPDPSIVLLAGASPSATVCWFVGTAGTVMLTRDGRQWERVGFPERIDLTTVTATDARSATVVAADGRTFLTTNAGQSWQVRQK